MRHLRETVAMWLRSLLLWSTMHSKENVKPKTRSVAMWSKHNKKRSQRADKNFKGAQSERIIKLRSNERVRQISSGINLSPHKHAHTHTYGMLPKSCIKPAAEAVRIRLLCNCSWLTMTAGSSCRLVESA